MPVKQPCGTCMGTGTVEVPTIREKVAYHLANHPDYGLQLLPWEIIDAAAVMGIGQDAIEAARDNDADPVQPA
jgi:hypothetical protein